MGKKTNTKAKERQQRRKAKEAELNARWLNLKKADAQDDPLEILPDPFKKYQKNGLDLRFETRKMKDIDLDMKNWVMALFEKNMRGIYEKSKMGWNDEEKMNELLDDDAWYLIATDNETDFPRAFAHFGYDMEVDIEAGSLGMFGHVTCHDKTKTQQMQIRVTFRED